MKKLILFLLIILMLSSCIGKFNLTRKLYNFNTGVGDKWINELVFLGLIILPVYELSMLGDVIIFNTIEFWTGSNPVAMTENKEHLLVESGDSSAVLTYNIETDKVRLDSFKTGKLSDSLVIEKNPEGVIVKDTSGNILYTSSMDDNGGISIIDSKGNLVKYITPEEVNNFDQCN